LQETKPFVNPSRFQRDKSICVRADHSSHIRARQKACLWQDGRQWWR